jgi:hypothetical protein
MAAVKPLRDDEFAALVERTLKTGLGARRTKLTVDVVSDPN